ncbi:hypothetical protein NDU88_005429 [Pleurodeles waltl]|uniref:Uncharacterized protein n=1 Tax=Pleurodeles waltl TaxID=8319 RepID=A0AAV7LMR6_PLEWA|nr:hypothetical protein NDU88_005429 [Pleurodeles waltl]
MSQEPTRRPRGGARHCPECFTSTAGLPHWGRLCYRWEVLQVPGTNEEDRGEARHCPECFKSTAGLLHRGTLVLRLGGTPSPRNQRGGQGAEPDTALSASKALPVSRIAGCLCCCWEGLKVPGTNEKARGWTQTLPLALQKRCRSPTSWDNCSAAGRDSKSQEPTRRPGGRARHCPEHFKSAPSLLHRRTHAIHASVVARRSLGRAPP